MKEIKEIICPEGNKLRLDVFLFDKLPSFSRSRLQGLILSGNITVNNKLVKPSYVVKKNDIIKITFPDIKPMSVELQNIPLNILYEDEDIIVINKPQGLTVHPGAGRYKDTLVNALLYYCKDLTGVGGTERPGIVHRLDKDTSGVMVVAKNDLAHNSLQEQIKNRKFDKKYLALTRGKVKSDEIIISTPLGRDVKNRKKFRAYKNPQNIKVREAITHGKVLKRFDNFTLLEIVPETGRTHQIRVHLSSIGHPVVGDALYGGKANCEIGGIKLKGQLLHSYSLGFLHPKTQQYVHFTADLPLQMKEVISKIEE